MDKKSLLKTENYSLATFQTTHQALHAEKILEDAELPFIVVPTPREVSSGCGLAIRFFGQHLNDIRNKFIENDVVYSSIYEVAKGSFERIISSVAKTTKD